MVDAVSTGGHHDLFSMTQQKDRDIEKEESQEIITTLQAKLQEYKQQLPKTTG